MYVHLYCLQKIKIILHTNQPIRLKDVKQLNNRENNLPKDDKTEQQKDNQVSTA